MGKRERRLLWNICHHLDSQTPMIQSRVRASWPSHSVACGYLGFYWTEWPLRGSSGSIFTTSTTATLLFNILEMQVKILFEKRHLLLKKKQLKTEGSGPAACMNLCSKQSCIFFSDPSSNQDLFYSIFGCLLCETEICFPEPFCPSSAFWRQIEIV